MADWEFLGWIGLILVIGIVFRHVYMASMKIETLNVQEPWFTQIANRRKVVEGRPGGLDRLTKLQNATYVRFTNNELRVYGTRSILCKVWRVTHYMFLETYLDREGWQNCAPHARSYEDAVYLYLQVLNKDGVKIFSHENLRKVGGICAIEFEKV